jgi:hypothetical protein
MACRTPFEKIVPHRLAHLAPLRAGQALSLRSFFPIPPCVCADDSASRANHARAEGRNRDRIGQMRKKASSFWHNKTRRAQIN